MSETYLIGHERGNLAEVREGFLTEGLGLLALMHLNVKTMTDAEVIDQVPAIVNKALKLERGKGLYAKVERGPLVTWLRVYKCKGEAA